MHQRFGWLGTGWQWKEASGEKTVALWDAPQIAAQAGFYSSNKVFHPFYSTEINKKKKII